MTVKSNKPADMITVSMRRAITPQSVAESDAFIIAHGFGRALQAIESQPDIIKAQRARTILANHEEHNGRNPDKVRIYRMSDIVWIDDTSVVEAEDMTTERQRA